MTDFNRIYYGARLNVLNMMKDRNYKVSDNLSLMTSKEFDVAFEKKQMDITGVVDDSGRPVYIKIIEPNMQFNTSNHRKGIFSQIATYFSALGMNNVTGDGNLEKVLNEGLIRLIVIYNSRQPSQLQNKYEEEYITHRFIEVYQVHNMYINPTTNRFQAKYRLITSLEEIKNIYARYDAKSIMMGSICIDDPINRYYGGRPAEANKLADLYEITRGGTNIFYRKVTSKRMNLK